MKMDEPMIPESEMEMYVRRETVEEPEGEEPEMEPESEAATDDDDHRLRCAMRDFLKAAFPDVKPEQWPEQVAAVLEMEQRPLTTKERKRLPSSAFAIPETRSYPLHDEAHGRAALSRVSQFGTPEEQRRVRSAVKSRFPNIGEK